MRVMEIRDDWGLENLKPGNRPDPAPAAGEAVVRIEAASVNYRDLVMAGRGYGRRSGDLPLVPVLDGAGTVVATGPGVTRVAVGDRVCPIFAQTWIDGRLREDHWTGMLGGPRDGVLQEPMLVHEDGLVRMPPHLDAVHAAALPCAAVTAWNAIVVAGRIKAGDTVLTQGTGGVSLFAVQFAKALGARVIVTSSRDDKLARARQLGADETINYAQVPDWGRRAREIAGPAGSTSSSTSPGSSTSSCAPSGRAGRSRWSASWPGQPALRPRSGRHPRDPAAGRHGRQPGDVRGHAEGDRAAPARPDDRARAAALRRGGDGDPRAHPGRSFREDLPAGVGRVGRSAAERRTKRGVR